MRSTTLGGVTAPRVFCSDLARAAREPLAGTASHARGCVLISYPKRLWARDALASEGIPERLRSTLSRLADRHGVVTRLVAHEGPWNARVEVSLFPQNRRHTDVPLDEVATLLETSEPEDGEPLSAPVIACCTHGVRDACCARFGMAFVSALRVAGTERAMGGGPRVEVREATHLGGDRFAPTILVLPSGHTYGHLEPTDAAALLAGVHDGVPLLPRFRGSLWLDPLEQLAEIAAFDLARARSLEVGHALVASIGPIVCTDEDGGRATLRCTATLVGPRTSEPRTSEHLALELRCARQTRLVVGDCRAVERGRRGSAAVWVTEAVGASRGATGA